MVFRRPDPTFVLVTVLVAGFVACLTVVLIHLALIGGAFEPTYPELDRPARKAAQTAAAPPSLAPGYN